MEDPAPDNLRGTVTRLLSRAGQGDGEAMQRLMPLVYDDLRRRAQALMRRERVNHTLEATALVNEAYLRLVDQEQVAFKDRAHFHALAARSMRQILVDHARQHAAGKRGADWQRIPLEAGVLHEERADIDIVALDEALRELEELDERKARVVELRFFAGLSVEETAKALDVDERTVKRDWRVARTLLLDRLGG